MAQDTAPLVWVDMEMTGLVPDRDRIIEVAIVVTDGELNTIAEAPVWVVHQPDEVLEAMDSWNKGTHGRSGLIDKVKASKFSEAEVEAAILACPLVKHCVVFGVPSADASRVEDIVACVSGDATTRQGDLVSFLHRQLTIWQMPRRWWITDALVPDERGKLSRAVWRCRYLENGA